MKIIKDGIEELMNKIGYDYLNYDYLKNYSDEQLNTFLIYWMFFDEKADEIMELLDITYASILYTRFYWSEKYFIRLDELGEGQPPNLGDLDIYDYQFRTVYEAIDHELPNTDWDEVLVIRHEVHGEQCNCSTCREIRAEQ